MIRTGVSSVGLRRILSDIGMPLVRGQINLIGGVASSGGKAPPSQRYRLPPDFLSDT